MPAPGTMPGQQVVHMASSPRLFNRNDSMGQLRARQVLSPNVNELLKHGYPSMRNQFVHTQLVKDSRLSDHAPPASYEIFSALNMNDMSRNQHRRRQETEHVEREKQKDFYRFNVIRNKIAASSNDDTTTRVASVKPSVNELKQRRQSYISAVEVLASARQEAKSGSKFSSPKAAGLNMPPSGRLSIMQN